MTETPGTSRGSFPYTAICDTLSSPIVFQNDFVIVDLFWVCVEQKLRQGNICGVIGRRTAGAVNSRSRLGTHLNGTGRDIGGKKKGKIE